jgi:hypothetical protein
MNESVRMEQSRLRVRETLSKVRSFKAEAEVWTSLMLAALVTALKEA